MMNVNVLRLDHRIGRDTRITTHVCLTSRAFGASKIYLSGEEDHKLMENVRDTADRWGGNFEIEYAKNYMGVINKWKDNGGKVVHLTMYGSQAHEIVGEVQESCADILIVVGGAKVPGKVYKSADWNVSVTTQPHSEVSSLAVFQHLLMDGKEFEVLKNAWEIQPENYEELILLKGIGPKKIRALALISDLVFGEPASWEDPVKYSFTHGGKDGFPYPVDKEVYDNSINTMRDAIDQAKLKKDEKMKAIKRLDDFIS